MAHHHKSSQEQRPIPERVFGLLVADRRLHFLMVWVALAVAVFAATVLGWGFISGRGVYWQHPLYDAGAHLSGWLFYKQDAWRFPFFDTIRMGYPDGTSIILTDSIPLVAIIAKAVGLGLWGNVQYFGLFVFGSYVLNGVALVWLLRQLGVRNVLGALFAVTFACFTTLYNIQFESFYAQFIVIFSAGFYFRLVRTFSAKEMYIFAGLVLASLLLHPYLFAMSVALYGATVVTLWRRGMMSLGRSSLWLGGFVVLLGVLYVSSGYATHPATGYQEQLFGTSATFALDPTELFRKDYSVDEIGMYVGLGFWLLVAVGLIAARDKLRVVAGRHPWMVAVLAAFLLLALSNTFFWAGREIFHINLPSPLLAVAEMFRASKRFIMPIYYIGAVVAVVLVIRSHSRALILAAVLALLTQVVDVSYFVGDVYASARTGQPTVLDENQWHDILRDATVMQVFPSYSCLFNYRTIPLSQQWTASLELYQIAAKEHVISNSVRASRRTKDCAAEAATARLQPPVGNVYVYLKDDKQDFILEPSDECQKQHVEFSYGIYCQAK